MFNLKCRYCGKIYLYHEGDKSECKGCKEYIGYSDMATIAEIKEQEKGMVKVKFVETSNTKNPAQYWKNICKLQQKQTDKGISKYGFILEDNEELTDIERITYLQEELIDGLMYCEHLKRKMKGLEEKECHVEKLSLI